MNYCPAISGTIAYRWEIGVGEPPQEMRRKASSAKKKL